MSLHHTLTPDTGYDVSHGGYYIVTEADLRRRHVEGALTVYSVTEGFPLDTAQVAGPFGQATYTIPLNVPLCGSCDQQLDNMNCADCCIAYVPAGLAA